MLILLGLLDLRPGHVQLRGIYVVAGDLSGLLFDWHLFLLGLAAVREPLSVGSLAGLLAFCRVHGRKRCVPTSNLQV